MGVVDLDIFVQDPAAALASFDVIQVERSITDEDGPFSSLTVAAPATAASLLSGAPGPYTVGGTSLELKLDSGPQVLVIFSGIGDRTTDQVVEEINAAFDVAVASNDAGRLRLTSTLTGTQSKVEVVGGSAAVPLGFTAGQRDIGDEPYISLVSGQSNYAFADRDGEAGYWYRVRFYNTNTELISEYSAPFQGAAGTLLSGDSLSIGSVDMTDATGVALSGQRIHFVSVAQPLQVEGFQVALDRKLVTVETDNAGHAEVTLVRGLKVRVMFEETGLVREILVPDAATFDVLAAVSTAPDPFSVAVPNLPSAPRRST